MKLRTRVLLIALCLCLVFGAVLAAVLQVRSFRENLRAALQTGLDASDMLAASLTASLTAYATLGDPEAAPRAVRVTAQYMTGQALLAVTDPRGALLYDNFADNHLGLFERMPAQDGVYTITLYQDTQMQLLRRQLTAAGQPYTLYFGQDISHVYTTAKVQAQRTAWLLAGLCLGLALTLWLALRASFRPLARLEKAALRIAQGDWAARAAATRRRDEVGQLSGAFNAMAEATQQHIAALTQRDQAQKQFIADMAHELKSPLTSMIGYADLMRRSHLEEGQRQRALEAIVHQGERLERMGFKLLHLARLEGGEPADMRPCEVAALVREAADTVAGRLAEKQLTLTTEHDGARITCDRDLMAALLQNLLQNAIKASSLGGRIWLSGSAEGFTVRDEGIGIAPEHLPHVFEAFYMADKSRARTQQGAGLGLALCRRIAQLHGMELGIQSAPGQGTTVSAMFTP